MTLLCLDVRAPPDGYLPIETINNMHRNIIFSWIASGMVNI